LADRTAFMLNRSRLQVSWVVGRSIAAPALTRLRQQIAVGKISGAVELMPILSRE